MQKRIAVITGASCGIGKGVALNLAKQNYHVVLISRNEKELNKVKNQIKTPKRTASIYMLDVSDPKAVSTCFKKIIKQHKRIDVLFNNAGIIRYGEVTKLSVEDFQEVININLLGAIYVAKVVAKQMKKQKSGYIINLASIAGLQAFPKCGAYNASKYGFVGFSDALFQEMLPYHVNVTAICPGFVNTDMARASGFPTKEMIRVSDIVDSVNFLLSLKRPAVIKELRIDNESFYYE